MDKVEFQQLIRDKGRELYREMDWRDDVEPYRVMVSELMLQQTQVDRVRPKFAEFMAAFPGIEDLTRASLAEVLRLWQGLGYNRRAQYLHRAAEMVMEDFSGIFPVDKPDLLRLPGVGVNTAGAIRVYSYNLPEVFVETNVRTVYFHHFFSPLEVVSDQDLMALVAETMDRDNPRQFYWALMDYGSWLKRQGVRNVGQSRHYRKQSKLEGSVRQVRGRIVAALAESPLSGLDLEQRVGFDERYDAALDGLIREGLIKAEGGILRLGE